MPAPFLALPALALAAGLGFFRLGAKSLWLDEATSVRLARLDPSGIWRAVTDGEPNMSLYYLTLHYWLGLGTSEAAVRSLSALAAAVSIVPFFLLCRSLFGRPHAVVASVLLSVNAFFIQYAQEARSYSLVLLLVIASSVLFLRALSQPTLLHWLAYVIVGALACYAHVFAGFVILAHSLFALVGRRDEIRRVILADVAMAALIVPLLLWIREAGPKGTWIKRPTALAAAAVFEDLAGHGGKVLLVVYFLSCCVAVYSLWRRAHGNRSPDARDARRDGLFLLSWLFVPILGSFAYSVLRQPLFVPRYLIVALPPLVMMAALGVVSLRAPGNVILLAALMVLAIRGLVGWYTGYPKAEWRGATSHVLDSARAGDVIAFQKPYGRTPFEYYVLRSGRIALAPQPLFPAIAWGQFDFDWEADQDAQDFLMDHPVTARRLWLILSHNTDAKDLAMSQLDLPGYSRKASRTFTGVRVVLYARGSE